MSTKAPTAVAEEILGSVDWDGATRGFCACPGESQHTSPTHAKDCQVMLDGAPTVYCFHSSCLGAVESANRALRRALGGLEPSGTRWKPSAEDLARQRERERLMKLGRHAKEKAPEIFEKYAVTADDLFGRSPVALPTDPAEHWRTHLETLFAPEDVLWIGATTDSCNDKADERRKADCRKHFRTVGEWLTATMAPGQFTCPTLFQAGVHSRSNRNAVLRRYLVVESDVLTKDQMRRLFAWLNEFLTLRAVVDTAGKSLHGWFQLPGDKALVELRVILPAMGCDPALFKLTQPCRLPGARRDQKWQHLTWLGPSKL